MGVTHRRLDVRVPIRAGICDRGVPRIAWCEASGNRTVAVGVYRADAVGGEGGGEVHAAARVVKHAPRVVVNTTHRDPIRTPTQTQDQPGSSSIEHPPCPPGARVSAMEQGELHGLALRIKDRLGREIPEAIFEGPTRHGDDDLLREISGKFDKEGLTIKVKPAGWEAWDRRGIKYRLLNSGGHDDVDELLDRCRSWPLEPS